MDDSPDRSQLPEDLKRPLPEGVSAVDPELITYQSTRYVNLGDRNDEMLVLEEVAKSFHPTARRKFFLALSGLVTAHMNRDIRIDEEKFARDPRYASRMVHEIDMQDAELCARIRVAYQEAVTMHTIFNFWREIRPMLPVPPPEFLKEEQDDGTTRILETTDGADRSGAAGDETPGG